MRCNDLYRMSVGELQEALRDRLWLGRHLYDTRFHQDAHDLFVDAWRAGDDAFRDRLNEAIGRVLTELWLRLGSLCDPSPILPLVFAVEPPAAQDLLAVWVMKLTHADCGRNPRVAARHALLMQSLDAVRPRADPRAWSGLWREQVRRAVDHGGSPVCLRLALSALAYADWRTAVTCFSEAVVRVREDRSPRALEDLVRPLLDGHYDRDSVSELGGACIGLDDDTKGELLSAVAHLVRDEALAAEFARGCDLTTEQGTEPQEAAAPQWPAGRRSGEASTQTMRERWAPLINPEHVDRYGAASS